MPPALAVTALALTTGAFHEDGLADSADGLFGGQTPERRLEIMKDSRVGSYGAIAIGLSLLLRVARRWHRSWRRREPGRRQPRFSPPRPGRAPRGCACSRRKPPRAAAERRRPWGSPRAETAWFALGLSGALAALAPLVDGLPLAGLVLGLLLASLAVSGLARLARRLIGGQTGDILGAAQQIAEIAIYLGFALMLGGGGA